MKNRTHIKNSKRLNINVVSYLLLEYIHYNNTPLYYGSKLKKNRISYIGINEATLKANIKILYSKKLIKKKGTDELFLTAKSKNFFDKHLGSKEQYLKSFDLFWEKYPSKIGKKNALDAFLKLPFESETNLLQSILKGIQNRLDYEKIKSDKEFLPEWPHASTYLNARRWEDEFKVDDKKKKKITTGLVYKPPTKEVL